MTIDRLWCKAKVKWNGNHYFAGQWVYGYIFIKDLSDRVYIMDTEEDEFGNVPFQEVEIDEKTICQYTGKKDDNGNDIYEHDIVEVTYTESYVESELKETVTIQWDESEVSFTPFFWNETCEECDYSLEINSINIIDNEFDKENNNYEL